MRRSQLEQMIEEEIEKYLNEFQPRKKNRRNVPVAKGIGKSADVQKSAQSNKKDSSDDKGKNSAKKRRSRDDWKKGEKSRQAAPQQAAPQQAAPKKSEPAKSSATPKKSEPAKSSTNKPKKSMPDPGDGKGAGYGKTKSGTYKSAGTVPNDKGRTMTDAQIKIRDQVGKKMIASMRRGGKDKLAKILQTRVKGHAAKTLGKKPTRDEINSFVWAFASDIALNGGTNWREYLKSQLKGNQGGEGND